MLNLLETELLRLIILVMISNDLPRTTAFSEVGRFDISGNKENRFMVYVKDRLFEGERQLMMVNALFDPISGQSMINQYGQVDTVRDLGSMDSAVDGSEAVLRFFPNKSEFNNYNVTTLSYNLNELVGSATTQIAGFINFHRSRIKSSRSTCSYWCCHNTRWIFSWWR